MSYRAYREKNSDKNDTVNYKVWHWAARRAKVYLLNCWQLVAQRNVQQIQHKSKQVECERKLHGATLTWCSAVVADAKAAVGDLSVTDELQVQTITVRTNDTRNRSTTVLAEQRRRRETTVPIATTTTTTTVVVVVVVPLHSYFCSDVARFRC